MVNRGEPQKGGPYDTIVAFWFVGLLNRITFIVMLACAEQISEGGTALVYLFSMVPRLIGNVAVPSGLYSVSYGIRMYTTAALFASSHLIVGFCFLFSEQQTEGPILIMQLLGVGVGALGYGIGESSLLALGGRFDSGGGVKGKKGRKNKGVHLTSFSSGSGLAGLIGYLWKALLNDWIGLSIGVTLCLGVNLAIAYGYVFYFYLKEKVESNDATADSKEEQDTTALPTEDAPLLKPKPDDNDDDDDVPSLFCGWSPRTMSHVGVSKGSTLTERTNFVTSLWPYMVPLFWVYFAEYGLQSGVWTAIGFPAESTEARAMFYLYNNWIYQAGNFISRSTGTLYEGTILDLWFMASMQLALLLFFILTATYHFLYNWSLLGLSCGVGMLAGAVYTNACTRINKDLPAHQKEFALASASIANSVGAILADGFGLVLQSCLYEVNNIQAATVVSCPVL